MRRPGLPLALLALLLAGLPATGQVESWGVAPGVVEVNGAQPGQAYLAKVQLQNQFDSEAQVTVERSGEAGGWTTLDAPSSFTLAARSSRDVTLTIAVPAAQGPGRADGQVTFFREPDSTPSGSGASTRRGAGVLLHVDVGGTAVERLTWSLPRAEDAAEGADAHAFATARNEGNVRTTARLLGEVLPFEGSEVLRNGTGALSVRPGEQGEVQVTFKAGLPVGQYRVHLHADGLDATLPFKVVPPGTLPPDGTLKAILHPDRATAGQPVRIDAWFQNTGAQPIRGAVFKGEARKGGTLLAPLQSDALAVAPGQSVNLTVYWTPPASGTYTLAGTVLYDGFLTPESQSLLNVDAAESAQSLGWWWLALLALLVALAVAAWAWKRRKERRAPPRRPQP
ncbi:MAG: hypothetical protein LC623_08615 [Halobacteriales archaeon]|nr:hypothetical protein [Halobacteriales archaeon]